MLALSTFKLSAFAAATGLISAVSGTIIESTNPNIFYHGRWDTAPGTWWSGSGFKLAVENLSSLTLNLGKNSTAPLLSIGVSLDWGEFQTVNVSVGSNAIPLGAPKEGKRIVRINVQGWQNNRLHLESLEVNDGAKLLPYVPQKLSLQFIGDSLSSVSSNIFPVCETNSDISLQGQFLPKGINQAWPFLVGEALKAEHSTQVQPGATLTVCRISCSNDTV
jgi:hypothetical protein